MKLMLLLLRVLFFLCCSSQSQQRTHKGEKFTSSFASSLCTLLEASKKREITVLINLFSKSSGGTERETSKMGFIQDQ
jgi:hypothetical protein